jgi:Co/Zn/Cd efflux system component
VELAAGLVVRSTALLGDSLDMLADALSTASVSTPSLAPSVRALSRRS